MKTKYGFTLIEILVALVILAIIGSMTVIGLQSAIRAQKSVNQKSQQLAMAQTAIVIIERDLIQMINRPVIDVDGSLLPAVIVSYPGGKLSLEFTHAGFINPYASENRTTLQRVKYTWDGKTLMRTTWPVLDRAADTAPETQILLPGVSSFDVRFMDNTHPFSVPSDTLSSQPQPTSLPLGIELNLEVEGLGKITRVISLLE